MILTCSKSWEASSCIAYNQKHEQINNKIKATNDYINIVNPEEKYFLRKLELCSAEQISKSFLQGRHGGLQC